MLQLKTNKPLYKAINGTLKVFMKRIIIIGCPGSGKSTLGKKLAKILNLPLVHLDQLFWRENWISIPNEEFDALLLCELKKDKWILDGNFHRTLDLRLDYCDTVILLNYPTPVCYFRVIKRVIANAGKTRSDMTEGCPERFDREFLKYVLSFKKKKLPKIKETLAKRKEVNLIEIKSDYALKKFLKSLNK